MFVHESGYRRPVKTTSISQPQSARGSGAGPQRIPTESQLIAVGPASRSHSPRTPYLVDMYDPTLLDLSDPTSLFLTAYRQKSMEGFMTVYSQKTDMRDTINEGSDVAAMMPQLSNSDEALRLAVLAFGTVALSKQDNDANLARQGRNLYSRALVETRRALQHPVRCRSTAILAIPHVRRFLNTANVSNKS
jgi:hypothetical protein